VKRLVGDCPRHTKKEKKEAKRARKRTGLAQ